LLAGAAAASAETTLPCRQPQLSVSGPSVYVVCGTPTSLLVARSDDGGRALAPQAAIDITGQLALGSHRGPRIVALGNTLVVTAIVGDQGGGKDGDVLAWRSVDGGQHWSTPIRINRVVGSAREGLHAMTGYGETVVAAWLDLREKGTTLVVAVSTDGGAHWGRDAVAYRSPSGGICECCHPSLATDRSGRIVAMFRNVADGARDMYVIGSHDNGRTWTGARKLGKGTWSLNACPMDGGAIAFDGQGNAVSTWRRDQQVYLGWAGSAESAIGHGVNPTMIVTGAGPLVAWNGTDGLMIKPSDGKPTLVDPQGRFAALASIAGGVVIAFERDATSVVRPIERRN
jgi:hypothetical protein